MHDDAATSDPTRFGQTPPVSPSLVDAVRSRRPADLGRRGTLTDASSSLPIE
jgi:hypothetical protein